MLNRQSLMLTFTKMNGAGNDFVMLDNRDGKLALEKDQIAQLCDRHRGIGADGLLVVEPAQNGANFRMRYYNADGGEAEMCGNGARCFGRYAQRVSGQKGDITFETQAGVITAQFLDGKVRIQMSEPHSLHLNDVLDVGDDQLVVHSLNTGVPHAVVFVDALEKVDVRRLGAALRYHPHFAPKGTNANFVEKVDARSIAIRTYERGVEDETLACGTGMVACAIIFHELTAAVSPVAVKVRGGDTLEIGFRPDNSVYRDVTLTGPADFVFDGQVIL
jgi:diaminopimelate epimerase